MSLAPHVPFSSSSPHLARRQCFSNAVRTGLRRLSSRAWMASMVRLQTVELQLTLVAHWKWQLKQILGFGAQHPHRTQEGPSSGVASADPLRTGTGLVG